MDDALHSLGSQKVLLTRVKVKRSSDPTPYRRHAFRHEIRWYDTTISKVERLVEHQGMPRGRHFSWLTDNGRQETYDLQARTPAFAYQSGRPLPDPS
jgi:hypothetical protein